MLNSKKFNQIVSLLEKSSHCQGESKKLTEEEIADANHALDRALNAVVDYASVILRGKFAARLFLREAQELELEIVKAQLDHLL